MTEENQPETLLTKKVGSVRPGRANVRQEIHDQQKTRAESRNVESASQDATIFQEPQAGNNGDELDTMSIEFVLPNRKVVMMQRPNFSLHLKLFNICKDDARIENLARSIMYVTKIDGQDVRLPQNLAELQAIMNQLGDEGVDVVYLKWMKEFVSAKTAEIPLTKKNVRG